LVQHPDDRWKINEHEASSNYVHRRILGRMGNYIKLLFGLSRHSWFDRCWSVRIREPQKVTAVDYAAWSVGVVTVLGGVASYVQFMIKHYLTELKPNGGSSIKDQVNRLEARVDTIIELLGKSH
jgi:hypothetical protein